MTEAIQVVASGLAVITTFLYIIGGVIVNIHLSRYKITEYQIVSVHYLASGVVYLLNLLWTIFQAFMVALFLSGFTIFFNRQVLSLPLSILLGVSITASVLLILPDNFRSRVISNLLQRIRKHSRPLRIMVLLYPFLLFLRIGFLFLAGRPENQDTSTAGSMLLIGIFVLTIDYARRVYGAHIDDWDESIGVGIGRGAPRRVQLAGDQKDMNLLGLVGIPLASPELTDEIYLLAETSSHYIVRIIDDSGEAIRIRKETITLVQHKRDKPHSDKSNSDKPWLANS